MVHRNARRTQWPRLSRPLRKSSADKRRASFEITEIPADWTSAEFDDSVPTTATEWTEADVRPKDGYDEISWVASAELIWGDASAELIWGKDLEVDNTILFRLVVTG